MNKLICEACNVNEAMAVVSVPGVPMSAAYCAECLRLNSHPMYILIANTACCGGLECCADWWREMVTASLLYQNKTLEWFNAEVAESMRRI